MLTAATLEDWRRPEPAAQAEPVEVEPSTAEIAKSEPSYGLFKAVSAMRGKTGYRLHPVPQPSDDARAQI